MADSKLQSFPTRAWSCSSLMRGASFLEEQKARHKNLSYEDLADAARKRLQRLKASSDVGAPEGSKAAAVDVSTPTPKRQAPTPSNSEDTASGSKDSKAKEDDNVSTHGKGEEAKRQAALEATLRRVCTPKKGSGKLEVSQEVFKQWKQGGTQRKALLQILIQAGGDKDSFKKKIEHIQKRSRRSKIHVAKGFYTKENMKKKLGWPAKRIQAAVAYCCHPSRAKTYIRRDKYEHNLKEYWIDVETTGSFENENEESLVDTTHGSGDAVDFDLGLPAPDPNAGSRSPGEDPAADETDQDISDDDEDGDARSARSRKVPDKEGVEREAALEAVENVSTVIGNLLKVQSRMETARDKLYALDESEESKQSISKITGFRDKLMAHHDTLADLKAYFDGNMQSSKSFDEKKVTDLHRIISQVEVECSRAMMEDTKLRKTLLKAKGKEPGAKAAPKAKAKAKGKPKRSRQQADEGDDEDERQPPRRKARKNRTKS